MTRVFDLIVRGRVMVKLLETIKAIALVTCAVFEDMLVCVQLLLFGHNSSRPEDLYRPGEVDFDPNEESLLAELHLATSGSNAPGVDLIIIDNEKLMLKK